MPNSAPKLTPAELGQCATQPSTVAVLLRLLGMEHASVIHHRAALTEWLERNNPTAELRLSLRANGYGLLLPRPEPRKPAPVQVVARAS